ncbi:MAG: cysteine hydrolase [Candidatus Freyarchaeota archaeon]|nr:cysteine hydrolase [Candidatus Jordarchaeia archaeon]MBS7269827.1 cysteine hydrolase [Candidatus Jordarchaeia archaeon]MBS7278547.1 cysteine hydrolase [Candidatus Jordarchaeia archaeon]
MKKEYDLNKLKKNSAVLVVDMQNDFASREKNTPQRWEQIKRIIPNIKTILQKARDMGIPVIYTKELHRAGGVDFGIELQFEEEHCIEGTPGAEIIEELKPQEGDYLITNKRRYSAFMGTDLQILLRGLKVENLILTGAFTDVCILATAMDARAFDYRVIIPEDAVVGTNIERHQAAIKCIDYVVGHITASKNIIEALS